MKPFIIKDDQRIPDAYGIKITYIDGKVEEYKGSHGYHNDIIGLCTFEDLWIDVPMGYVRKIEFDKDFSRLVAIKQEKGDK